MLLIGGKERVILRTVSMVFGDNRLTAALIDRLIHHSHICIFSGESYRLTQSMKMFPYFCANRRIMACCIFDVSWDSSTQMYRYFS